MEVTDYSRSTWRYANGRIYKEWNGEKYKIATVSQSLPWHENQIKADLEAEANGILMAHANRLYEACRACVMEGQNANQNGDVIIPSHVFELVIRAFERLKKT